MCSLCDAYSLLPNRWMMVNLRATRDTVVQGFERPRAPPRPHAGPAPRSYLTMHCARRVGRVGCRLTGFSHNIPYFNAIRNKRIITVNPRSPYPSTYTEHMLCPSFHPMRLLQPEFWRLSGGEWPARR